MVQSASWLNIGPQQNEGFPSKFCRIIFNLIICSILVELGHTFRRRTIKWIKLYVQGDHSSRAKPPVDIKTKVLI